MIKTISFLVGCRGKSHLQIGPFQSKIFSLIISLKASAWKLSEKGKLVVNGAKFCQARKLRNNL
jgi:hypothetical protein